MSDVTTAEAIHDIPVRSLEGEPVDLHTYSGRALLIVNVASECGLTPQYEGLEQLQERYAERGFSVLGFPCNQFGAQEPGSAEDIRTFCSTTYGVTFPMFEKIEVNGPARHPLYAILTTFADESGHRGDIRWNFEKFLVAPGASSVVRYSPKTEPDAPELVAAIERLLPE